MTPSVQAALEAERSRATSTWGRVVPERWETLLRVVIGSVLDVGCSSGAYVSALRDTGYRAFGIDLLDDPAWQGGVLVRGLADSLPVADDAVDTVVAFEVLEHLPDVTRALTEWRRVARHRLVLSVPNTVTPEILRASGLAYHHFIDRTHVNFFDSVSLSATLEDSGYRVQSLSPILGLPVGAAAFHQLGLPLRASVGAARVLAKLSRRKFHLSLLAVADVR